MLMRYIEEQVATNLPGNQTVLHLHVETYNQPAVSLYQSEGYEIIRTCGATSSTRSWFGGAIKQPKKFYYYMQKEVDDSGDVTESDFIGPLRSMEKAFKEKFKKIEYQRLYSKIEKNFEHFEEEQEAEKTAMHRKTYLDVLNDGN
jgi:hypothetical protein